MCDAFQSVLQRMSKIVHRVNAKFISLSMMVHVSYPKDYRIAQIRIIGIRIDASSESSCSIGKFTVFHTLKQSEIFRN